MVVHYNEDFDIAIDDLVQVRIENFRAFLNYATSGLNYSFFMQPNSCNNSLDFRIVLKKEVVTVRGPEIRTRRNWF